MVFMYQIPKMFVVQSHQVHGHSVYYMVFKILYHFEVGTRGASNHPRGYGPRHGVHCISVTHQSDNGPKSCLRTSTCLPIHVSRIQVMKQLTTKECIPATCILSENRSFRKCTRLLLLLINVLHAMLILLHNLLCMWGDRSVINKIKVHNSY